MHIIDNGIYHDDKKLGWIDGAHVRDAAGNKLGYFENNCVYNDNAQKIAYIEENSLKFENGQPAVSLQHVNEEIQGTYPLLEKCAVHVLLED